MLIKILLWSLQGDSFATADIQGQDRVELADQAKH